MLIVISALPGYYISRTLFQIYRYEELSLLKYEWIPIMVAGASFIAWVVEGGYFDLTGNITAQSNGIRDATLFLSVSLFAIAMARFAETWGTYARGVEIKRKMLAQQGMVEGGEEGPALGAAKRVDGGIRPFAVLQELDRDRTPEPARA